MPKLSPTSWIHTQLDFYPFTTTWFLVKNCQWSILSSSSRLRKQNLFPWKEFFWCTVWDVELFGLWGPAQLRAILYSKRTQDPSLLTFRNFIKMSSTSFLAKIKSLCFVVSCSSHGYRTIVIGFGGNPRFSAFSSINACIWQLVSARLGPPDGFVYFQ